MTPFSSVSAIVAREFAPMISALHVVFEESGQRSHPLMRLTPSDLFGVLLSGTTDRDTTLRLLATIGRDFRFVPAVGVYRWAGHSWTIDAERAGLYSAACDALARLDWMPLTEDRLFEVVAELGDLAGLIAAMGDRAGDDAKALLALVERIRKIHEADQVVSRRNKDGEPIATVGDDRRAALRKYTARVKATATIDAAFRQFLPAITISADLFDRDPDLFAVQNGVINLRTGEFRTGRRRDYISRRSPVTYDPRATCPLFRQTLNQVFRGRPETRDFFLRWMGYCLTGDASEQKILLLTGGGRNGKGLLMGAISAVAGEYYTQPPMRLWLQSRGGPNLNRGPDEDKAKLNGARLVVSDEVPKNSEFDEATMKEFSGQSPISTSFKNKPGFTFVPIGKLVLMMNVRPKIDSAGAAIWERIQEVQFRQTFLARTSPNFVEGETIEVDTTLRVRLAAEMPGILSLLVNAARAWYRDGLGMVADVAEAVAEYREETDALGLFLKNCCEIGAFEQAASDLYGAYEAFQERNALGKPISQTAFGLALGERKFGKRTPHKVLRTGLRLSPVGHAYLKGLSIPAPALRVVASEPAAEPTIREHADAVRAEMAEFLPDLDPRRDVMRRENSAGDPGRDAWYAEVLAQCAGRA